jgi:hypothetical protein
VTLEVTAIRMMGDVPDSTVPGWNLGGPVILQSLGVRLAVPLIASTFNISPNNSLPGSSQVTSFLGGLEQWAVYACLLGLIVGGAGLWWGVQNGSINRSSMSQHKILAAFAGAVIIGAGAFLITWAFNFGTSVS